MIAGGDGSTLPVVELRQYTLVPGQRDTLIELFDTHLVDGQQASGMHVIGQFSDLDDPNRFVWLRGFSSMATRRAALRSFYFGPAWQRHRDAANATMLDSDNVLLVAPVYLTNNFPWPGSPRLRTNAVSSVISVSIIVCDRRVDETMLAVAREQAIYELAAAGAEPVAVFVTEDAPNNFPELPIRADNVLVWITRCSSDTVFRRHQNQLTYSSRWFNDVLPKLMKYASGPLQELHLRPTRRSWLR